MALVEQVIHRHPATTHVVDRHRADILVRRLGVEEHEGKSPLAQSAHLGCVRTDRHDEDAVHPLLGEQRQVSVLLRLVRIAVAQHHREAGRADRLLGASREIGEEGIGDIEHQQAHHAAPTGPELASRLAANEVEPLDSSLDLLSLFLSDQVGVVKHVGDGSDRNPCHSRNVSDVDRRGQTRCLLCAPRTMPLRITT